MAKPAASGAAVAKPRSRVAAWIEHHGYSLVASLGRMLGKPWAQYAYDHNIFQDPQIITSTMQSNSSSP